jgi:hypothetical protein
MTTGGSFEAENSDAPLTLGQQLDARLVLDDQTVDALDDQHRRLAARVKALENTVAMLEGLMLGARQEAGQ